MRERTLFRSGRFRLYSKNLAAEERSRKKLEDFIRYGDEDSERTACVEEQVPINLGHQREVVVYQPPAEIRPAFTPVCTFNWEETGNDPMFVPELIREEGVPSALQYLANLTARGEETPDDLRSELMRSQYTSRQIGEAVIKGIKAWHAGKERE